MKTREKLIEIYKNKGSMFSLKEAEDLLNSETIDLTQMEYLALVRFVKRNDPKPLVDLLENQLNEKENLAASEEKVAIDDWTEEEVAIDDWTEEDYLKESLDLDSSAVDVSDEWFQFRSDNPKMAKYFSRDISYRERDWRGRPQSAWFVGSEEAFQSLFNLIEKNIVDDFLTKRIEEEKEKRKKSPKRLNEFNAFPIVQENINCFYFFNLSEKTNLLNELETMLGAGFSSSNIIKTKSKYKSDGVKWIFSHIDATWKRFFIKNEKKEEFMSWVEKVKILTEKKENELKLAEKMEAEEENQKRANDERAREIQKEKENQRIQKAFNENKENLAILQLLKEFITFKSEQKYFKKIEAGFGKDFKDYILSLIGDDKEATFQFLKTSAFDTRNDFTKEELDSAKEILKTKIDFKNFNAGQAGFGLKKLEYYLNH